MRATLRDTLEDAGFRVAEASDGDALLRVARQVEPEAIVLDHQMPGPRGLDVLPILRERHPHAPVVLMTSFGGARTRETALGLGAAAYLDKPFRMATLLEALRGALAARHPAAADDPGGGGSEADDAACPLRGLTVLVVDDNAGIRHSLTALLRLDGTHLLTAEDGSRALDVVAVEEPDVVLCDLQMPGMDGFEFVRRIRSDPRWSGLPVVAVTGLSGEGDELRTRRAGFDAHLAKPLDYLALRRCIRILGGRTGCRGGRSRTDGRSATWPGRRAPDR